jgi:UDP-N-acetylmuramate--alanine ligase
VDTLDLSKVQHIHCIGIGGIGLSAIAEVLINEGFKVSGSDMSESEKTDQLIAKGAKIYLRHRARNVGEADLVVYSSAVPPNNPELEAAAAKGIPAITRAQMLGHLMQQKKVSVAVAGAHGKTTTTSIISLILMNAGLDPTILVGGNLGEINGNVRLGSGEYFVTEACEYMDSFLSLAPMYAVILNIDSDHLDYFKNIEQIVKSFEKFVRLVPPDGAVVAFDANPFVTTILRGLDRRVITYGYSNRNDYSAGDIEWNSEGHPSFTVYSGDAALARVQLAIPGEHNILNALAAFSCCCDMGVSHELIAETLEKFTGTERRFDIKGVTAGGVKIVDDYAHHPEEIAATIRAARKVPHRELWILFQPHTYTRTLALHDDFAQTLTAADKVILAEIYAAREKNVHQISSKTIAAEIKAKAPGKDVFFFDTFEDIAKFVYNNAEKDDLVITMGAGDIYKVGELILEFDDESFVKERDIIRGKKID